MVETVYYNTNTTMITASVFYEHFLNEPPPPREFELALATVSHAHSNLDLLVDENVQISAQIEAPLWALIFPWLDPMF